MRWTCRLEYDDATFKKAVSSANFAAKRVKSTDAEMKYNGTEYYIEPETYGNEFDDADLQVMVKDTVDRDGGVGASAAGYRDRPAGVVLLSAGCHKGRRRDEYDNEHLQFLL
ncbi:MAG: hypothetical protein ACLTSZ_09155 [Lachnospiraceae bacterium]